MTVRMESVGTMSSYADGAVSRKVVSGWSFCLFAGMFFVGLYRRALLPLPLDGEGLAIAAARRAGDGVVAHVWGGEGARGRKVDAEMKAIASGDGETAGGRRCW